MSEESTLRPWLAHPLSMQGVMHLAEELAKRDDIDGAIDLLTQATARHGGEHLPWFLAHSMIRAFEAVRAGRANRRRARDDRRYNKAMGRVR